MSITPGLYKDFIYAWKSGRRPSMNRDRSKRLPPYQVSCLSLPLSYVILKKLKNNMPIVTMIPIQILLFPNFSVLSLTLEKNMPTIMTERRLHDLIITTAGKDASMTALLYVNIAIFTIIPQLRAFLKGIWTGYTDWKVFMNFTDMNPMIVHIAWGKNVNIIDDSKYSFLPLSFKYSCFNLNQYFYTFFHGICLKWHSTGK